VIQLGVERSVDRRLDVSVILLCLTSFFIVYEILNSHYTQTPSLIEKMSWIINDPPWMPVPNQIEFFKPFWGGHYFGDFLIWLGYATTPNPYAQHIPAQSLPLGVFFFKFLLLFGVQGSFILWIVLSSLLPLIVIYAIDPSLNFRQKLLIFTASVPLTASFIVAIDRGGIQFVSTSLLLLGFIALFRSKVLLGYLLLIVAVSIKPYLVLPLIYLLARKYYKYFFSTLFFLLISNLIFFIFLLPGSLLSNLSLLLKSMVQYQKSDSAAGYALGNGTSLFGGVEQFFALIIGFSRTEQYFSSRPLFTTFFSLFWIIVVAFIVFNRKTPMWVSFFFCLSLVQLVVASTGKYGANWLFIAIILFKLDPKYLSKIGEGVSVIEFKFSKFFDVMIISSIFLSLLPLTQFITSPDGIGISARTMLSPLSILIVGLVALYELYFKKFLDWKSSSGI
jgi:hypothetical protein